MATARTRHTRTAINAPTFVNVETTVKHPVIHGRGRARTSGRRAGGQHQLGRYQANFPEFHDHVLYCFALPSGLAERIGQVGQVDLEFSPPSLPHFRLSLCMWRPLLNTAIGELLLYKSTVVWWRDYERQRAEVGSCAGVLASGVDERLPL